MISVPPVLPCVFDPADPRLVLLLASGTVGTIPPVITAPAGGMYPGNTVTSNKTGQWYSNGVAISGQTGNSLVIPYTVNPADTITQAGSNALTIAAYDTDAANYFTRAQSMSATAFDLTAWGATYAAAFTRWKWHELFIGLKVDSVWSKITEIYPLCGVNFAAMLAKAKVASGAANVCINSGFVSGDLVGAGSSPGLVGNLTKYLDVQRTSSQLFTAASGHMAAFHTAVGSWTAGVMSSIGDNTTQNQIAQVGLAGGNSRYRLVSSGPGNQITGPGDPLYTKGSHIVTRQSSSLIRAFVNGVQAGSDAVGSSDVPAANAFRVLGNWNGRASIGIVGSSITNVETVALHNRILTFMTSLGYTP